MRIGEVAERSGVSARMVRYFDHRGYLPARDRASGQHREFDEEDVNRLRMLQALLAAGVPAATAAQVARGDASGNELRQADQALARSSEQAQAVRARLAAGVPRQVLVEQQLSLAFDLFLARTRMESLMSFELSEAGVSSGDYAVLSLVSMEQLTPAGLARLVGVAPSTLARRLRALVERRWLTRSVHPFDARSWVLTLTPEGEERVDAALPHARRLFRSLNDALQDHGLDPETLRSQLQLLSSILRSMLPEA